MIYSNKKIKSCNAKWPRQRERQKKISRSNEKKKTTLHVQHTFLCISFFRCFAWLQRETSYLHILRRKCRKCSPNVFFTFVLVRFFSLPLIFTWLAASISHFVTANFHVFYQRNSAPLFLSNTLALSLFSTSVKTLQFRKSESTLSLLFFFSLKSRGEGAGMQFRAKKPRVAFGLAYLSI